QQNLAGKWVTGGILRKTSVAQEFRAGQRVRSASGGGAISSALPVADVLLPGTGPTATRTSGKGTPAQANRTADSREGAIFSRFPVGGAPRSFRPRGVGPPRADAPAVGA